MSFINHKPINIDFDHKNPNYKNRVENNAELRPSTRQVLTAEHVPELLKMAMDPARNLKRYIIFIYNLSATALWILSYIKIFRPAFVR